jgi:hypothetical protein
MRMKPLVSDSDAAFAAASRLAAVGRLANGSR